MYIVCYLNITDEDYNRMVFGYFFYTQEGFRQANISQCHQFSFLKNNFVLE